MRCVRVFVWVSRRDQPQHLLLSTRRRLTEWTQKRQEQETWRYEDVTLLMDYEQSAHLQERLTNLASGWTDLWNDPFCSKMFSSLILLQTHSPHCIREQPHASSSFSVGADEEELNTLRWDFGFTFCVTLQLIINCPHVGKDLCKCAFNTYSSLMEINKAQQYGGNWMSFRKQLCFFCKRQHNLEWSNWKSIQRSTEAQHCQK